MLGFFRQPFSHLAERVDLRHRIVFMTLIAVGLVLTISVRYSQTNTDSTQYPGTSVPYDPLVCQLRLGWRF